MCFFLSNATPIPSPNCRTTLWELRDFSVWIKYESKLHSLMQCRLHNTMQAAQHRRCDFSVFLTTWNDMQSDLPPSCKLDTDSAQPCLDNMFFLVLFILFMFFVIVRMVLLQTVTSVTCFFFLFWFICVTFSYIHWTGKIINVLCCFPR